MAGMVEKVARAIHDHWQNGGRSWEDCCEKLPAAADDFRAKARAAIEAMREPTEGMMGAAMMAARDMPDDTSVQSGLRRQAAYTAAIEAALSEDT